MKVTTPKDMEIDKEQISHVLQLFEEQLKQEEKGHELYHLIISKGISRALCDAVELAYIDAGWNKVSCKTSSENGERAGLTGLRISVPS